MEAARATPWAAGTPITTSRLESSPTERFDRGLTWAGRLEAEHDNLRAALDDLQARDPLHYLQLAGALGWFWMARSHFAEGTRRLEDTLASNVEDGPLSQGADLPGDDRRDARTVSGRAESTRAGDHALGHGGGRG